MPLDRSRVTGHRGYEPGAGHNNRNRDRRDGQASPKEHRKCEREACRRHPAGQGENHGEQRERARDELGDDADHQVHPMPIGLPPEGPNEKLQSKALLLSARSHKQI